MRRMFTVLAVAFTVAAFSSMTFAQAPAQPGSTAKPAAAKAAQAQKSAKVEAKPVKKGAAVATGTIDKFDAATKTLTVKTKKGDENFTVTSDTKIAAGAKAGKEDELVAGKRVKVAYTEAAGQMTATKVTLVAGKAQVKKTEKSEKK